MMDKQRLVEVLEQVKTTSEKRKFIQSVEFELKLKNVDASKPENSFTETHPLPKGLSTKRRSVCVFADGASLPRARESGADAVMTRSDIEALAGDKKAVKKLAKKYDFFVADATLMPLIGRVMGQVLGPRGKMPTPFPVNNNPSKNLHISHFKLHIINNNVPSIRWLASTLRVKTCLIQYKLFTLD
ncbi:hypothetical protein B9Q08_02155 [Candidatus Marsarchaeota G2 archaeon ECH_B_SAG-M15]|uniref:Ribosomal protein n=1 Tax=Candidatus Marsarchaeota G2 archaeon ECH_B_SAG-M15 TaxID=1978162 RepID=A0A2R6AZI6_9ARCH|nr:MAG: hypothetical protein B9Q08_02155 [Candidatus Marsarchaeota G2 archaeon ECH_B_SAG-M15]